MTKVKHYLLTLGLVTGENLHSYVICNENKQLERVRHGMMTKAEELGGVTLPIMLETDLGDDPKEVQDYLFLYVPNAKELIESVKDFHLTMWAMPEDDPDNERLMELH